MSGSMAWMDGQTLAFILASGAATSVGGTGILYRAFGASPGLAISYCL
jgi:hypothetical protein